MTPFVADSDFTLYVGDVRDVLRELPAESVHTCVTSPPYWGLRDYGTGLWEGGASDCDHLGEPFRTSANINANWDGGADVKNKEKRQPMGQTCSKCGATRVDQQLGLEATPELFVAAMVDVFREVRRVLRSDGTLWLNLGDSYAQAGGSQMTETERDAMKERGERRGYDKGNAFMNYGAGIDRAARTAVGGLKPKDLCGIPWRVAFALQADGWYLRSDIVWSKPNPMPESVTDRPTKAHEYVFLLTKAPRYYYDADAIREPAEWQRWGAQTNGKHEGSGSAAGWIGSKSKVDLCATPPPQDETLDGSEAQGRRVNAGVSRPEYEPHRPDGPLTRERIPMRSREFDARGRNVRSVWEIATQPYPDAHFATFPEALPERCIKAGSSERGCCPECGAPWERTIDLRQKPEPLGAWLRQHREASGLSAKQLCEVIGAHGRVNHGGAVSNWEADKNIPTAPQWEALKAALSLGDDKDALVVQWHEFERGEWGETPNALTHGAPSAGPAHKARAPQTTGWRPTCNHYEGDTRADSSEVRLVRPVGGRVHRSGEGDGVRLPVADASDRVQPLVVPCTVLDPFMGSGTTALVARRLGRRSIGVELNPEYAALCARRLQQLSLLSEVGS